MLIGLVCTLTITPVLAAGNDYAGEMRYMLGKMYSASNMIINSGDTIVHMEADLLKVGETYTRSRLLYEGKEYYVISVGCQGVSGISTRITNQYGHVIPTNDSDVVTGSRFYVPATGYYNISNTIRSLDWGYSEGIPYYFFFVIAYSGQ